MQIRSARKHGERLVGAVRAHIRTERHRVQIDRSKFQICAVCVVNQ